MSEYKFETKEALFELDELKQYVETYAKDNNLIDTLNSIDFAYNAHLGVTRKNSDIPYIYHPLNLACHAISLGIKQDDILAACLLHDVVEDSKYTLDDLPVKENTKQIVKLLTHLKDVSNEDYYNQIKTSVSASFVKLLDRCNNITTLSWGFSKEKALDYIKETEIYVLPLLDVLNNSEYKNISWLLKYQIESILDIYKRLL